MSAPDSGVTPLGDLPLAREAIDRATARRTDEDWLAGAWADAGTRVLTVIDGEVAVSRDGPEPGRGLALAAPADAPAGERIFLGLESGGARFAVIVSDPPPGVPTVGLRELANELGPAEVTLVVEAVALANWHVAHRHCARCGAPTEVAGAGHLRRCSAEGSEHYPRTDPAVIMAVVDAEDRLLLGRQAKWPARRYSTLAGFVEPGESLEAAVRREVHEEVGVRVGAVRYLGSQPWPFPSSLMLGFVAQALTTEISVDGTEIAEAFWSSRPELAAAVGSGTVLLAPQVSIARRLIEHWYGGPLQDRTDLAAAAPSV